MSLAPRHEPIPLTPIPEGLVVQVCDATKPLAEVEKKLACSTCGFDKTEAQMSKIVKRHGGRKCLACVAAAKNSRKPENKLKETGPVRAQFQGYNFSDLRWPTARPAH